MRLGYQSESLNNLLASQPTDYQIKIKNWWGGKLKMALMLTGLTFSLGLIFGSILGVGINLTGICIGFKP